jgi:hypothetical protein
MSKHYKIINIPTNFFNQLEVEKELSEIVKVSNNPAGRQIRHWDWGQSPFNAEAYRWVENLGLQIGLAEIFYSVPGGTLPWHDDGEQADNVKFNFVWGSNSHLMYFGELVDSNTPIRRIKNRSGTYVTPYNESDLTNIESVKVVNPIIFNGNVPHQVTNFDTIPRWCLSMLLWKDGQRLKWNDALTIFKEYINENAVD